VVPPSAIFVIGNDDYAVSPNSALLDRGNEIRDMLLARDQISVTWVFVVWTQRLDEAHRRQLSRRHVREKVLLILKMCLKPGGLRIEFWLGRVVRRWCRFERSVLRIEGKGLVIKLEQLFVCYRIIGQRLIPAAGIPLPVNSRVI
jgi:hypothetical protein